MMVQSQLRPDTLAATLIELLTDSFAQERMRAELQKWHFPDSADQIVETVLRGTSLQVETPPAAALLKLKAG
jgi:UDP-N-acetylglucosamine:LPS N-acetylglucosamine transferase